MKYKNPELVNYKLDRSIELIHPNVNIADSFFNLIDNNRDYLSEYLPWVETTKQVSDLIVFLKESRLFNMGGQRLNFFINFQNQPAGSIGFVNLDRNKKYLGEIGYWLREDFQGQGIITDCCRFLIDHGFNKLELNRIEIKVMTNNLKSRAIPERLGFTHEGTLRKEYPIHGAFHDTELYSLLKEEYNK